MRVEASFAERFALLGEANYRRSGFSIVPHFKQAVLWQFPIPLRYRPLRGPIEPVFEVGPTLLLPRELSGMRLSRRGATGGAGLRFHWHGVVFEPGLRFTHWGAGRFRSGDIGPNDGRRNQLDAVFGVMS